MKSSHMRTTFFDFFVHHNHELVSSSSLIPAQDPTLLFTNAGMNQFKDLFLGLEKRSYKKSVTIQKCVRAGGKHNDLDNVGFTKRHLTFFEMMGNFSFGDYFKKEAIEYAWIFLTEHIGLPKDTLHATVFETDDQAYDIWHTVIGLPKEKIHRLGADTNFWQMGDVGPCGPCTEIFIDRGLDYGSAHDTPATDSERFLEIWNLVFMQYERQSNGDLKPLKQTGVDTGMGLERLALVMQNKDTVFETDIFANIMHKIEELTGKKYYDQSPQLKGAFNVLADHIRSATLLIADGCASSNEGRGYVLRKIIRRAALFSQKLTNQNIFPQLSQVVIEDFGQFYPDLKTNAALIYTVLTSETEKFSLNLQRGTVLLKQVFEKQKETKSITGLQAFKLYDTYGFPVELIVAEAREQGYQVDINAFEKEMAAQKIQSTHKTTDSLTHLELDASITSEFTGYHQLETVSTIVALVHNNQVVESIAAGQEGYVIAAQSPFFIVGGGQVPDQGWLTLGCVQVPLLEVRYINTAIAARVQFPVDVHRGDPVTSLVDCQWRTKAMKNHTATHMLQAALIELFGKQIKQSGSLVHPDYLRFDFTYHENLKPQDIMRVEQLVNNKIMENIPVTIEYMSLKEATDKGALAFFGDKYKPDNVRMVQVDDFSTELCGGTHVSTTGEIGLFKIVEITALSAGHRRIVAVTGPQALALFQNIFSAVKSLSTDFKTKIEDVPEAVAKQKELLRAAHIEIKQLKQNLVKTQLDTWIAQSEDINGLPFLYLSLENMNNQEIHDIATSLMQKKPGIYWVMSNNADQSLFVCMTDKTLAVDMNALSTWLKEHYGLRGGVKNNVIQGGGKVLDSSIHNDIKKWFLHHV